MQIDSNFLFGALGAIGMITTIGLSFTNGSKKEGSKNGAIEARLDSISVDIKKIDKDMDRLLQDTTNNIKAIAHPGYSRPFF